MSNSIDTELNGSYSGFGIEITSTKENYIKIVNVIEDSPAEKAKLQKEYETILKTMKPSIQLARSLNTLSGKTGEFKWGVMLENNFNTIKRKK